MREIIKIKRKGKETNFKVGIIANRNERGRMKEIEGSSNFKPTEKRCGSS